MFTGYKSFTNYKDEAGVAPETDGFLEDNNFLVFPDASGRKITYYGCDFAVVKGATINGIAIRMRARSNANVLARLIVDLSWDNGVTWTATENFDVSVNSVQTIINATPEHDLFGRKWSWREMQSDKLNMRMTMEPSASQDQFHLDEVKMGTYFTPSSGQIF